MNANINPQDVSTSVAWNQKHPSRKISFNIPLPKLSHIGGEIHVGGFVRSKNGNVYTVVSFSDCGEWAVIVPLSNPLCAYSAHLDSLAVISLAEVTLGQFVKAVDAVEGGTA